MRPTAFISLCAAFLFALAACGGGDEATGTGAGGELSGRIEADGSSTVGPYTTAAAERFQGENSGVQLTVGVSGTGGGFERFCAGETDLSNASRPIEDDEKAACEEKGITFTELQVANDALTVVTNPENDWADCLTVEQLKKIWDQGSKVKTWKDVDASWPDEEMPLYGPGTDSGTFDYFTGVINGDEGRSRSDYAASEDDNVTRPGRRRRPGRARLLRPLVLRAEPGQARRRWQSTAASGCVAPSAETAQNGTYTPLARPLFIYVKNSSLERPEVKAFLEYVLENEQEIAAAAQFVPLTDEQRQKALADLQAAESA